MAVVVVADDEVGPDFEGSYKLFIDRAAYVAQGFFHNRGLAEDVAQETLTRAFARWDVVRRHEIPEAWIVRTAKNVCQEFCRRDRWAQQPFSEQEWDSNASPSDDALVDTQTPSDDAFADAQALLEAMRKLSKRQQDVLVWRFIFHSTVKETARALGISESKVRDATFNGVKKLRRLLGDQFPERWHD